MSKLIRSAEDCPANITFSCTVRYFLFAFYLYLWIKMHNLRVTKDVWKCLKTDHDGRIVLNAGDPPGQRCIYIAPGEHNREVYRLSTLVKFPASSIVDERALAAAGFYFTGFKDRVKCFSCGACVQDWETNDNPSLPGWHKRECLHAQGRDESNVSISSFRLARRPVHQSTAGPSSRQGRPSNVQQSASFRHEQRIPPASVVAATNAVESSFQQISMRSNPQEEQVELFPCLNPMQPHMRSEDARMNTFLDNLNSWPAHRIRTSMQQIALAGFYYLGERDRVKCWYCSGGLQNWERDDDPWREHAKWYPMCEFLLQRKGLDYVSSIVVSNPSLRRPTLRNPATFQRGTTVNMNIQQMRSPFVRQTISTNIPQIVDPREEQKKMERLVAEALATSSQVDVAREMGFEDKLIKHVLTTYYMEHSRFFENSEQLVSELISLPSDIDIPAPQAQEFVESGSSTSGGSDTARELSRLRNERLCKGCHSETANVLLMPCGHLASCVSCARNFKTCPLCKLPVNHTVRTFIA